ncbi:MAG: hypothetical protein AB1649_30400, partial [Chloroflexota bacterium]
GRDRYGDWEMKNSKVLWVVTILIALFAAIIQLGSLAISSLTDSQISSNTLQLLNDMNNNDVTWIYPGFFPLSPNLYGASSSLLIVQENINPWLVDALADKDKFVAAHVLLTWRTKTEFPAKGDEWNGLKVQCKEEGVFYEGNDLDELQKYWREKLKQ